MISFKRSFKSRIKASIWTRPKQRDVQYGWDKFSILKNLVKFCKMNTIGEYILHFFRFVWSINNWTRYFLMWLLLASTVASMVTSKVMASFNDNVLSHWPPGLIHGMDQQVQSLILFSWHLAIQNAPLLSFHGINIRVGGEDRGLETKNQKNYVIPNFVSSFLWGQFLLEN